MFLKLFSFIFPLVCGAVLFGDRVKLGEVASKHLDENSGLAASRVHPGILYGHNDHGDTNRLFALDPVNGHKQAELTIAGAENKDWEDLCIGVCGSTAGWCIYIAESGDHVGYNVIYKVREPSVLRDGLLSVIGVYTFTWNEPETESLMIDPEGDLYVISKVSHGDALFAKLPRSGWESTSAVTIPGHCTVRLDLRTDHNDPQGADISPDGTVLLVKTEEDVLFYPFTSPSDYVGQLAAARPQEVTTYVRRLSGEAVAWDVNGTGFYTLPEGVHQQFNYYPVTGSNGPVVG